MEKKTALIEKPYKIHPVAEIEKQSRLLLGQKVYNNHCYFCHGYQGDGRTVAGSYLTPSPRDFTAETLSEERMRIAVREGRKGTAMMAFKARLTEQEINAVVTYVRENFMQSQKKNTAYHIPENGWFNHEKYRAAFPFARGTLSINAAEDTLSEEQQAGRALYLSSCITCHEQKMKGRVVFETRPVSMPRAGYSHRKAQVVDAQSGATPYAKHDIAPQVKGLSEQEQVGERLFQENCAFCHAADGTGKNWIGQFLEPHARNLTSKLLRRRLSEKKLRETIKNGLENTTMPAWKNVLNAQQIEAVIAYVKRVFLQPKIETKNH